MGPFVALRPGLTCGSAGLFRARMRRSCSRQTFEDEVASRVLAARAPAPEARASRLNLKTVLSAHSVQFALSVSGSLGLWVSGSLGSEVARSPRLALAILRADRNGFRPSSPGPASRWNQPAHEHQSLSRLGNPGLTAPPHGREISKVLCAGARVCCSPDRSPRETEGLPVRVAARPGPFAWKVQDGHGRSPIGSRAQLTAGLCTGRSGVTTFG